MPHLSATDPAGTAYRQAPSLVDADAVAAAASQEAGLERRGPDYAVVRPGESAQRLADDLATSVPLGIGPAVGYLPVVSVPTVDVRA